MRGGGPGEHKLISLQKCAIINFSAYDRLK